MPKRVLLVCVLVGAGTLVCLPLTAGISNLALLAFDIYIPTGTGLSPAITDIAGMIAYAEDDPQRLLFGLGKVYVDGISIQYICAVSGCGVHHGNIDVLVLPRFPLNDHSVIVEYHFGIADQKMSASVLARGTYPLPEIVGFPKLAAPWEDALIIGNVAGGAAFARRNPQHEILLEWHGTRAGFGPHTWEVWYYTETEGLRLKIDTDARTATALE